MDEFSGIRIGFDAKRVFSNRSGLGTYSRNLINSLRDYFPENSYLLFTPSAEKNVAGFDAKGLNVISPVKKGKLFSSFWRNFQLADKIKAEGIDLYHGLTNELPVGIHKLAIPSVVTIHDLIFLKHPRFYKPIDRFIYRKKVEYACKTANCIIAMSHRTKTDLIELLGIHHEKIEVVYQSVSPRFFEQWDGLKTNAVKEKYNLPEKFILSVGNIEERKNQLSILKAVVNGKIDHEVVLVGRKTKYAGIVEEFADLNKIACKVRFISGLSDEELPDIYRLASLMIYLSSYEGFGIPVIEAMAAGCPVIVSDASCLPETAGGAALLCPPDDPGLLAEKIRTLLGDDNKRLAMVSNGIERAKSFTPENSVRNLVSVYKKVLQDGK